jgi:hypothetical protein
MHLSRAVYSRDLKIAAMRALDAGRVRERCCMMTKRPAQVRNGGAAPATPGFNAVAPEWLRSGATGRRPAIPAAESTLGSHPCVALSSAQVSSEWSNINLARNALAADGDNPLNLVSHPRGSLH